MERPPERPLGIRCVVKADDQLGEGPCWSPFEGRLYWFDIKGRRLAWYEPASDERGAFDLPFRASAGAPRAPGRNQSPAPRDPSAPGLAHAARASPGSPHADHANSPPGFKSYLSRVG